MADEWPEMGGAGEQGEAIGLEDDTFGRHPDELRELRPTDAQAHHNDCASQGYGDAAMGSRDNKPSVGAATDDETISAMRGAGSAGVAVAADADDTVLGVVAKGERVLGDDAEYEIGGGIDPAEHAAVCAHASDERAPSRSVGGLGQSRAVALTRGFRGEIRAWRASTSPTRAT